MENNSQEQVVTLRYQRRFLGKLSDFKDNQERALEKAHLKAYLAGRKWFNFGFFKNKDGILERGIFLVRHDFEKIPLEKPNSRASKRFIKNNPYMTTSA